MRTYAVLLVVAALASFVAFSSFTGHVVLLSEGESGPVSPAYACAEGLAPISCSEPETGSCSECNDTFYCTYCGDGVCKGPENECNCVRDCGEEPKGNLFVTSGRYTGDLGGMTGADSICQQTAEAAGYRGTWVALLSDYWTDASDRVPENTSIVNMRGLGVALDKDDLADGGLIGRITDENGNRCEDDCLVWTGSYAHANQYHYLYYTEYACNEWTSSEGEVKGTIGNSKFWDSGWMEWNFRQSCSTRASLYCIRTD